MLTADLETKAESYGYKAANLMILEEIARICSKKGMLTSVPAIQPLAHDFVQQHLDTHCPQLKNLWQDFLKAQGNEKGGLATDAKPILAEMRRLIIETFEKKPLPQSEITDFLRGLDQDDLLMVRSTGKEDSADLANPGGNESIAAVKPTTEDISLAIGEVVASYFSEKSLEQRIKGKDDISGPPFMPVLLQKMIGEPLVEELDEMVVSGVMYTGQRGTTVNAAPGHGELIVNSKAPFDTFYITGQGVVNPQVALKPYRLVPQEIQTNKGTKRTLAMVNNTSKDLQNQASLPPHVAKRVSDIGAVIEESYGRPMDVEFVYKPKTDRVYIVQARPIPVGDLRNVVPSSIRPERIKEAKTHCDYQRGQVISSAGEATQVITDPSEVLIVDNVGVALETYLSQKDPKIKAVVVKKTAPTTSHEAAEFNSKAIPVIQVDDLNKVKTMLNQPNTCVVIDPQRKLVLDWHTQLAAPLEHSQQLYEGANPLLAQGLFKSPMALVQTVIPPSFEGLDINAPKSEVTRAEKIGELLEKARSNDTKESQQALSQLMTELYELTQLPTEVKRLGSIEEVMDSLETIEASHPGNVENAKVAVRQFLNLTLKLAQTKQFSPQTQKELLAIYKNALLTGAEIDRMLDMISNLPPSTPQEAFQPIQRELLNLVNRLEAVTLYEGNSQVFSHSIKQSLGEEAHVRKVYQKVSESQLTKEEMQYLIQLLKPGKLANNTSLRDEWEHFCIEAVKDPLLRDALSRMTAYYIKNDLGSFFINTLFKRRLEEKPEAYIKEFTQSLFTDTANVIKNMNKIDFPVIKQKVSGCENKINQWRDPGKFEELYQEFLTDFDFITKKLDELNIDELGAAEKSLVFAEISRYTETLDKSLKTLKSSLDYQDKGLQAEHFAKLLVPYHDLMVRQVGLVSNKDLSDIKRKIGGTNEYVTKESILFAIKQVFVEKCKAPDEKQLSASRHFGVSSAVITSPASFERQFVEKAELLTLEDLFTLFHQNIIAANTILTSDLNLKPDEMPELLKDVVSDIEDYKIEFNTEEFPAYLIASRYEHPEYRLQYNIPLAQHAAAFEVKYNTEENKLNFSIEVFGEARDRFPRMVKFTQMYLEMLGADIVIPPNFSEEKSMLSCAFEITPISSDLVYDAAKLAKMMARISFYDNKVSIADVVDVALHQPTRKEAINENITELIKLALWKRGARLRSDDVHKLVELCASNVLTPITINSLFSTIKGNTIDSYWKTDSGIKDFVKLTSIMHPDDYINKLAMESIGRSTFVEIALKANDWSLTQKLMDSPEFKAAAHPKAIEIAVQNKAFDIVEKLIDKGCYSQLNPTSEKELQSQKPELLEALSKNKPEGNVSQSSTGRRLPSRFGPRRNKF